MKLNEVARKIFVSRAVQWYSLGHREYHTFAHGLNVATDCNRFEPESDALWLAGLFHDAVYIAGSEHNEEMSAEALINNAREFRWIGNDIEWADVETAADLIRKTTINDHMSPRPVTDPLLATLLDCDLEPLRTLYFQDFVTNQKNILSENFLDPLDRKNLALSAAFLKKLYESRQWIYHTDYCRASWEYTARRNISRFCLEYGV